MTQKYFSFCFVLFALSINISCSSRYAYLKKVRVEPQQANVFEPLTAPATNAITEMVYSTDTLATASVNEEHIENSFKGDKRPIYTKESYPDTILSDALSYNSQVIKSSNTHTRDMSWWQKILLIYLLFLVILAVIGGIVLLISVYSPGP